MDLEFYPAEERAAAKAGGALAVEYGCHVTPRTSFRSRHDVARLKAVTT